MAVATQPPQFSTPAALVIRVARPVAVQIPQFVAIEAG